MYNYAKSSNDYSSAATAATIVFAVPAALLSSLIYMHAYNAMAHYWHWYVATFWQVFAVENFLACVIRGDVTEKHSGWTLFWVMIARNTVKPALMYGIIVACIAIFG